MNFRGCDDGRLHGGSTPSPTPFLQITHGGPSDSSARCFPTPLKRVEPKSVPVVLKMSGGKW